MTREEKRQVIAHINEEMTSLAQDMSKKSVAPFNLAAGGKVAGRVISRGRCSMPSIVVNFNIDRHAVLVDQLKNKSTIRFIGGGESATVVVDWRLVKKVI